MHLVAVHSRCVVAIHAQCRLTDLNAGIEKRVVAHSSRQYRQLIWFVLKSRRGLMQFEEANGGSQIATAGAHPFFGAGGTFFPALRASDKPIAIACFGLVTFLPLRPLFSVPCFISLISVSTFLLADGLYFRVELLFFAGAFFVGVFFVAFFAVDFFVAFFVVMGFLHRLRLLNAKRSCTGKGLAPLPFSRISYRPHPKHHYRDAQHEYACP